ncbi:MAG: hypothetical protein ACKVPX_04990 [Myxococcaceae bacterium]
MDDLEQALTAFGLLKADAARPRQGASLLEWCDANALDGGLSISPGVRPDECLGSLLFTVGGVAAQVRAVDIREGKQSVNLTLMRNRHEFVWRVRDVPALVRTANRTFAQDTSARFIWQLGEWEGRLQLWCVAKQLRTKLQRSLAASIAPAERSVD